MTAWSKGSGTGRDGAPIDVGDEMRNDVDCDILIDAPVSEIADRN